MKKRILFKSIIFMFTLLVISNQTLLAAVNLDVFFRSDSLIDNQSLNNNITNDEGKNTITLNGIYELVELNSLKLQSAKLDIEKMTLAFEDVQNLKDIDPSEGFPSFNSYGGSIMIADPKTELQLKESKEIIYYQAKNGIELAKKRLALEKQNVRHEATELLIAFTKAHEGINLAKANVERSQKYVDMTKKQFEKGLIIKSSMLDSEVAFSQAENGLKGAEIQYRIARENLLSAIGLEDSEALRIDLFNPEVTTTKIDEYSMDNILDFAFKHRIDYLMQEDNMNYEKKRYEIYNDHYTYYGNQQDKIREKEIVYEKEKLNLIQIQRDLRSQVYQVVLGFNNTIEQLESLQKNVDKAKESLRIAELRYDAGMGTLIEVLNAQVGLTQAENQLLDGKYQIMTMKNNLEKTTGGTFEEYQIYLNSLEDEKQ